MRNRIAIALLVSAWSLGAENRPDWVREMGTRALPSYPPEVHSATLFDEMRVTVQPDGSTVSEIRQAVRVLAREGDQAAAGFIPYFRKVTRIRDFRAWLINPDGSVKPYGKESVVDKAAQEEFELYADERVKLIEAHNAPAGSTFAWSAEFEDRPFTPQVKWFFQGREPALISRCILALPQGWKAQSVTFNHLPVEPQLDGNTYTWELKDLANIKEEKRSPQSHSLAPWMGITYFPDSDPNALRAWKDVSVRESKLVDSQTETNEALNAKVRELTASSQAAMDRIRAISKYVQAIKYVAIETNLAHGGGSQPHPAVQVFEKQYGDCKDKANLMRTMLRQIGVDSYPLARYYGDRDYVRPEWASPDQFNHEIIAIKVADDVSMPAVLTHPVLGHLLIFDSTDSYIPLGFLPEPEQGSHALLIAAERGGVVQLPTAPAETNRTDVKVEGTLTAEGGLEAKVDIDSRAEEASRLRALQARGRPGDFQKLMEAWLARNVNQVEASQIETKDSFDQGEVALHVSFKAPRYAQTMQGRLLVFRPAVLEPYERFPVQSETRVNPLVLDSECYHKQVRVKLPENFNLDEMPEPASLTSSFGKYSSTYKVDGKELVFTEELDISATTLPADKYREAREFFGRVAGAEHAPLVLVKN